MIKNERQYRITRVQADKFADALANLKAQEAVPQDVHPLLVEAERNAMSSQLADLETELQEYDALKAGNFHFGELVSMIDLPRALIRARIARGLSQKDLADRLGLKEQQVQRYEATDYASASFLRIREIVAALGVEHGGTTGTDDIRPT